MGRLPIALLACLVLAGSVSAAAPQAKSRSAIVVPADQAKLGEVYYVHPGLDAQVVFTSDAPLGRFVGVSSQVVGYVVAPREGGRSPKAGLLKGEFRLPVRSLRTGLMTRDESLQSGRWLDALDHPDIVFTLDHTENVSQAEATKEARAWSAQLVGALSMRGVTRPLSARATITHMPASLLTKRRAPGDLLVIRAAFPINLRDFGLNDPAMSVGTFAQTVTVSVFLLLSNVPPPEQAP